MMRACDTPKARAAWMYSELAQLERLAAQQAARPVQLVMPRMMHRNSRRKSARCAAVVEQLGMGVDVHLHHQHRRGDQQHARNGVERGVEVLDDIVHPAAEIPGQDAEERCATGSMTSVVSVPMTRPVRMLFSAGRARPARPCRCRARDRPRRQCMARTNSSSSTPSGEPASRARARCGRRRATICAQHLTHRSVGRGDACQPGHQASSSDRPARLPASASARHACEYIRPRSRLGILQMRAAVLAGAESRASACRPAARTASLAYRARRERRRVGLLAAAAQRAERGSRARAAPRRRNATCRPAVALQRRRGSAANPAGRSPTKASRITTETEAIAGGCELPASRARADAACGARSRTIRQHHGHQEHRPAHRSTARRARHHSAAPAGRPAYRTMSVRISPMM